jgi:hypothetical protein
VARRKTKRADLITIGRFNANKPLFSCNGKKGNKATLAAEYEG